MADIKWIHLSTDIMNDEKIQIIEALPEGETICWVWVKLLGLAGKCNDHGYIYISPELPYSDEQLSKVLHLSLDITRLAIRTFEKLKMVQFDSIGRILVVNFLKWNDLQGMEKIRLQTRDRVRRYRQRQLLAIPESVTLRNAKVTHQGGGGEEEDKDKEKEYTPPIIPLVTNSNEGDCLKKCNEIWELALERIKTQVSKSNYRTWFSSTVGVGFDGENFIIGVPNEFTASYLAKNQRSLIENALIQVSECLTVQVLFKVRETLGENKTESEADLED